MIEIEVTVVVAVKVLRGDCGWCQSAGSLKVAIEVAREPSRGEKRVVEADRPIANAFHFYQD